MIWLNSNFRELAFFANAVNTSRSYGLRFSPTCYIHNIQFSFMTRYVREPTMHMNAPELFVTDNIILYQQPHKNRMTVRIIGVDA